MRQVGSSADLGLPFRWAVIACGWCVGVVLTANRKTLNTCTMDYYYYFFFGVMTQLHALP